MKKYSKNFSRDYEFYLQNMDKFNFSGDKVEDVVSDRENGKSAKECFHKYDSTGKMHFTSEPELLRKVIICKKSINFHIKQWVEGYEDMMEGVEYYLNQFNGDPPKWVETSFRKQLYKRIKLLHL